MLTQYGPGDEATWGPRTFHPLDPRNDPDDYPEPDYDDEQEETMNALIYVTDRSTGEDKNLLVKIQSGTEREVKKVINDLRPAYEVSGWDWDEDEDETSMRNPK